MLEAISSEFGEPNVVRSLLVVLCVELQPDSCHLLSFPSGRRAWAGVVVLRRVRETRLRSRDRWQAGCGPPGHPCGVRPGLAALPRRVDRLSERLSERLPWLPPPGPRGARHVPLASQWPPPADAPGHRGCKQLGSAGAPGLSRRCCRSSPTVVPEHPRTGCRCVPPQPPDAA